MTHQPPKTFLGRFVRDLDNIHSRIYVTIALLFYFVPVVLISIMFIGGAIANEFLYEFVGLAWVIIVVLPLMLTFGVFIVYRATYSARPYVEMNAPGNVLSGEEQQWDYVINKALDWHRFLMPLCLLNMFITLIGGFLLVADIGSTGDLYFGSYTMPLVYMTALEGEINESNTVGIPGSIFYLGMVGFMFQFLEMTRRRYVSRNIVPRFYLMSAFRLLQVIIAVVVIHLFLYIVVGDPPRELVLLSAFLVGMFPIQILSPAIDSLRNRLGMDTSAKLPITLINGIDNTLESLLQEENIDSVQILATTNVADIQKRTAIPERTLRSWQRQAMLFDVLGTEQLIHRFARIGINDFDDLQVLVQTMHGTPVDPSAFRQDFTNAMRIKSDEEAIATDSFWRVMVQVLIREYLAEFPEQASLKSEPVLSVSSVPEPAIDEAPLTELSISESPMAEAANGDLSMNEHAIIEAPMSELSITESSMEEFSENG